MKLAAPHGYLPRGGGGRLVWNMTAVYVAKPREYALHDDPCEDGEQQGQRPRSEALVMVQTWLFGSA
jgi:hypothetical protein